jgi:hypothetical protein
LNKLGFVPQPSLLVRREGREEGRREGHEEEKLAQQRAIAFQAKQITAIKLSDLLPTLSKGD